MTLYNEIIEAIPELVDKPEEFETGGSIRLQDDCDGIGAFIAKWEYSKSIPAGLKLGK